MPVIAHIMLALVYITASTVGAVALHLYQGFDAVTAAIIGATCSLALIQLHMAASRASSSVSEKDIYELKQEIRKLTGRIAQAEDRSAEIRAQLETELAAKRETASQEMRDLEASIQGLAKRMETKLNSVRMQAAAVAETTADGASILDAVKDALRENRVDLYL